MSTEPLEIKIRIEKPRRCLCCGSKENVRRYVLADGRIYDACEKCSARCVHCNVQLNQAKEI